MFWLYLAIAVPALFVAFIIKPTSDTNILMLWIGITLFLVSLPWGLFSLTGGPLLLIFAVAFNIALLWALCRPLFSKIEANAP